MSIQIRHCHCGATASFMQDEIANCRCKDTGEWTSCNYCGEEIVEEEEPVVFFVNEHWHRACVEDAKSRPGFLDASDERRTA